MLYRPIITWYVPGKGFVSYMEQERLFTKPVLKSTTLGGWKTAINIRYWIGHAFQGFFFFFFSKSAVFLCDLICFFSKWFHILWSSKIKFSIKYWDQNQKACEKEEKQSTKNQSSQVEVQVYKIKIKMKWSSFFCLNMYLNEHLTSSRVRAFEFVWKFIYSKQDLGYFKIQI